jgi:hypothetical protein
MTSQSLCLPLFAIASVACSQPAVPVVADAQPPGSGMPLLERRSIVLAEADLPDNRFQSFDVNALGSVVYVASHVSEPKFRLVDSTGRRLAAFGRNGAGPGETQMPIGLWFRGDTIRTIESGRGMLIELDSEGRSIRDRRLPPGGVAIAWVGADSLDHWDPFFPDMAPESRAIFRRAVGDPEQRRRLVGTEDSVFAAAAATRGTSPPLSIPYAATEDRFWVGDGWDFRIRAYSADGTTRYTINHAIPANTMGPRQLQRTREMIDRMPRFDRGPNGQRIPLPDLRGRLDTLERERVPHFSRGALHVDNHGRLWVIGLSNDSTSVDVFADTTWLGRVMLPCFAARTGTRAALGPGWLVFECEIDGGDWPSELQLYRIVERN